MNIAELRSEVAREWAGQALPDLTELIRIPAVSPAYDPAWQANGHLHRAVDHVRRWLEGRDLAGVRCTVEQLDSRPPILVIEVSPTDGVGDQGTVLLYGHLDRQPSMGAWSAGRGPWEPYREGDRLYGRGTVDDSYSAYVAVGALAAVRAAGGLHSRVVILLETAEESASVDLPAYVELLRDRLGDVSLVICLDSGGDDHERLWLTTSLRGLVQATVTVRVLDTPVHSGLAGGIVPDSFRILRQLLDRVEDSGTGEIRLPELNATIPDDRHAEVHSLASLADRRRPSMPLAGTTRAVTDDAVEQILNNTWRPTLTITGAAGLPGTGEAIPVIRNSTSLRLSVRLPPTVDPEVAARALTEALTVDVPYDASVEVTDLMLIRGWNAPTQSAWLTAALESAERNVFDGVPSRAIGLGGGIPFLEMLGRRYPQAQFLATGAVRPDSNVHAPDEWLSIPFARDLTAVIAHVLDSHARTS
ncbi:M20/M25/M40 family metallo-hydrolase [Micromonospora azadirachtae]|uniref:M20/M25/M40 family metallo-hydrolase n=1 Tax=Micromonospora azadirachtae TaxID=1970735 RepID=A0ABW2ZV47_9ACTN